jgi:phage FluMu gp28-like protein
MGERWFRREYLCEFEDSGSGVFGRDLVERAITETVEPLIIGKQEEWPRMNTDEHG